MIWGSEFEKLWINFSENHSDFPKKFFNFRSDTITEQSIINFSRYGSKVYGSIFFSDSELTFLVEVDMQPFVHFFIDFV